MFRQGDVLLVPVRPAEVPTTAVPAPRDRSGRMVLARGETTGHAHVIAGPDTQLLADRDDIGRLFVRVGSGASLLHEAHSPVPVPAGCYRVVRQRGYVPDAARAVAS